MPAFHVPARCGCSAQRALVFCSYDLHLSDCKQAALGSNQFLTFASQRSHAMGGSSGSVTKTLAALPSLMASPCSHTSLWAGGRCPKDISTSWRISCRGNLSSASQAQGLHNQFQLERRSHASPRLFDLHLQHQLLWPSPSHGWHGWL